MSNVVTDEPSRPYRRVTGLVTTGTTIIPLDVAARQVKLYVSTTCRVGIGSSATAPTNTAAVQTITAGDATGGTAVYTFHGQNIAATAWNAAAATFQTNFRAISSIGATGVTCAGGALNVAPVTVTFDGTTLSGAQALITVDGTNLTGGVSAATRVPTITTTTVGTNGLARIQGGVEEIYTLIGFSTDKYLYLIADAGTGTYAASFYK